MINMRRFFSTRLHANAADSNGSSNQQHGINIRLGSSSNHSKLIEEDDDAQPAAGSYVNLGGTRPIDGHYEADPSTLVTIHHEASFPVSLQEVDLQRMDRLYPPAMPRLYNHIIYFSSEFLLPLVRFLFFLFECVMYFYFLLASLPDKEGNIEDSITAQIIIVLRSEPSLNPRQWLTLLYLPLQFLLFALYLARDMYWHGWREYRRTDNLIRLMSNRHSRSIHCQFSYLKWRLFQLIRSRLTLRERMTGWVVRSQDGWQRFVFLRTPIFVFMLRGLIMTAFRPYMPLDPQIQILLLVFFAIRSFVYLVSLGNKLLCLVVYAAWIRPTTGAPGQRQNARRYWARSVLACLQRHFTKCMISSGANSNGGNGGNVVKSSFRPSSSQSCQTEPVLFIPSSASSDATVESHAPSSSLDSVSLGRLTPKWTERKPDNLRVQI
jgi:hypothetical protein